MLDTEAQADNAEAPMLTTLVGTLRVCRAKQLENAVFAIEVIEVGIVTEVRPRHPFRVLTEMALTDVGNVKDVKPKQP